MSNEQSEQEFLSRYQRQEFSLPAVTVDLVIFTVLDTDLKILLVRRGEHPFKHQFALPGGFVRVQDEERRRISLSRARVLSRDRGEILDRLS